MNKIPVYMMPGLAANPSIFERIALSPAIFEVILLEWEIPLKKESLTEYAKRISQKITHNKPVLIGVSFGGILVQEMANYIDTRKIIIISSVKSNLEFPKRIKFAKITKAYKLAPTSIISKIKDLISFIFGTKTTERIQLYEKFLSVSKKEYLDWALEQVVNWKRTISDEKVIHIHGDLDAIFPIQNIKNCIIVKGGTHIMILNKYKWLNKNLPDLILE